MDKELKFSDLEKSWNEKKFCVDCDLYRHDSMEMFRKCYAPIKENTDYKTKEIWTYIALMEMKNKFPNKFGNCPYYVEKLKNKKKWWQFFKRK